MPKHAEGEGRRLRPFWSGTIAFGLVSLPVSMFVANRGRQVSLRMLSEDGTPLSRRYVCPEEEKLLESEEIVRGFEVEKDSFVVVTDDELDALAPEKSQEIDLRRFVPKGEIDPVYFERAYFLAPGKGASKAYRLLARAMEELDRAGIATFVMRGKEYLVAIIAEHGVLRAETLRFADELRSPADVDLPELGEADAERVEEFEREIAALGGEELDRSELLDRQSARLLALVAEKLESGEDVLDAPEEVEPQSGDEAVDLMKILKQSLQEITPDAGTKASTRAKGNRRTPGAASLAERSKAELYERAKDLDISGRSGMTKEQLIEAIRDPR